ncbi:hypothetical protein [Nocardiopsis sp. SBT366]|uniref:TPR repeat region-containing protein n=1 Tax=Nocardiopsis sp. SBT366 TaxID=1580529 RepID=UPI000A439E93|nr:hypothetical protein [Nocardiopsis sp. SBT366]
MAKFDIHFQARITNANPDTIRTRTEELDALQARLLGRADDLGSTFYDTATEFTELMAWGIGSQTREELQVWQNAGSAIAYASSMMELWAQYVEDFKAERESQTSEWFDFREAKKAEIPDEYQGETITASYPAQKGFGLVGPENKCRSIYGELTTKHGELEERERANYQEFEDNAGDVAKMLGQGPTKENIQALIDSGINSWAFYNIDPSNYTMMVDGRELTEENAEELAEDLGEYWSGEKAIDENYHELMLLLSMITTNALQAQQGGTGYRDEEMDFLEAFYGALEEEGPGGRGVIGLPNIMEDGDMSEEEREHALGAIGEGILALSDQRLGGGYDNVPESVRNAIDIPFGYGDGGSGDPLASQEVDALTMSDLSELFAHTSNDFEGGYGLSTNLALSLGTFTEHWGNESDHWVSSEELAALTDVASRNKDANSFVLTGEHVGEAKESDIDYREDFRTTAIEGLFTYEWHDEGESVRQMTDWLAEDLHSEDPDDRSRAQEAFPGFMETITDPDMHKALTRTGTSLEEDGNNYTNASFSQYNIDLANSFADIFDAHIFSFSSGDVIDENGNPTTGVGEYDPERDFVELGSQERANFMQYLVGNDQTAAHVLESVDLYQQIELISYMEGESGGATSAREAGTLQGILNQSLTMESDDRYDDIKERIDLHEKVLTFALSETGDQTKKIPVIGTALSKGLGLTSDSLVSSLIDGDVDVSPRLPSYTNSEDLERNIQLGVLDYMTSNQNIENLNEVHRSAAFGGLVDGGAISVERDGEPLSAEEVSSEDFAFDSDVTVMVQTDKEKWNEDYRKNDPLNQMDDSLRDILNENIPFNFGDGEEYSSSTVVGEYKRAFEERQSLVEDAFDASGVKGS